MATAPNSQRDGNEVPTLIGVSSVTTTYDGVAYVAGVTPVLWAIDPTTGRALVDIPSGSGTVTSVSIVSANGFAGTVATATTTPAITLSTTINAPVLAGNGTSISAATLGNLTDAGTDGITVTGGTGAVIGSGTSLAQHVADTTHNGYLSSTDWNTFNGKQASGNYITALTGDVTASGPGSATATLATVNSNTGVFGSTTQSASFIVNAKGLITAVSNSTIAPAITSVTGLGTGVGTFLATPSFTNLNSALTGDSAAGLTSTQTLTNKRITKRVLGLGNSSAPTFNTDNYDVIHITGQSSTITSFTSGLSGSPVDGDTLRISVTGTGSISMTFGTSFESSTVTLPTTTSGTARLDMGFFYNTETGKWRIVALA